MYTIKICAVVPYGIRRLLVHANNVLPCGDRPTDPILMSCASQAIVGASDTSSVGSVESVGYVS